MLEIIVSGAISALITLIGWIITNRTQVKILEVKLNELNSRVEKHNQVVERTYALERKVDVLEERIDSKKE